MIQGISPALEVQDHLESGFKHLKLPGCGKFHDLKGNIYGVRDPKEEWSRDLLFKSLEAQKTSPPLLCGLVRRILLP